MDKEKLLELTVISTDLKHTLKWLEDRIVAVNKVELGFSVEENPYIGFQAAFSVAKVGLGDMERLLEELDMLSQAKTEMLSS